MDNETPATILPKLRTRLNDLLKLGIATPEGFGLYQQTILQLLGEFDRRKASCFAQAEQLRAQAAAVESQGHAFSACGSILFSVVHGYVELEEKRQREEQERAAERQASTDTEAAVPTVMAPEMPAPKKRTWSRKKGARSGANQQG